MSLLQEYMEPCQLIEKKRVPDGEGGFTTSWADGAVFQASVVCDTSMQARAAEKQGVTSLYTVTCERNAKLEYHDVFRRQSDGKIFRVTSDGDDVQTPRSATFQFSQVTAEEWELTR
ncbi:MAG: head-tail adaptor protein [Clostridiaceae bacterium]|nr:head-tail adaptor protein [Clostridiaceae bacterium]